MCVCVVCAHKAIHSMEHVPRRWMRIPRDGMVTHESVYLMECVVPVDGIPAEPNETRQHYYIHETTTSTTTTTTTPLPSASKAQKRYVYFKVVTYASVIQQF